MDLRFYVEPNEDELFSLAVSMTYSGRWRFKVTHVKKGERSLALGHITNTDLTPSSPWSFFARKADWVADLVQLMVKCKMVRPTGRVDEYEFIDEEERSSLDDYRAWANERPIGEKKVLN